MLWFYKYQLARSGAAKPPPFLPFFTVFCHSPRPPPFRSCHASVTGQTLWFYILINYQFTATKPHALPCQPPGAASSPLPLALRAYQNLPFINPD